MKNTYKILFGVLTAIVAVCAWNYTGQDLNAATTGIAPRVVVVDDFSDIQDSVLKESTDSIFIVRSGTTNSDGLGGVFVYSAGATTTADTRDSHYSYSGVGRVVRIDHGLPLHVGPDAASPTEYTIDTGAIVPTGSFFEIDTESDGASDDLDTITATNYKPGDLIVVKANNTARTVVLKDGTGNLRLSGDFSLDNTEDVATLMLIGTNWTQVATSNNGT